MSGEKTIGDITFRIRHTMMLVSDLERSIDFYTRLLGMDIQRIRPNPEKKERVGYVGYGTEDEYPGLELIETGGPGHIKEMRPWYGHVALYVSDLYKLSEKLKAEGVKFTLEPQPNRRQSRPRGFHSGPRRLHFGAHRASLQEWTSARTSVVVRSF
jgi:lactoylglutathione lyase